MAQEQRASQPLGVRFENLCLRLLEQKKAYKPSSAVADKEEGTDLYWQGQPVDLTLQVQAKDHASGLVKLGEGCYSRLYVSVRSGNGHHQFKQPVVVVHAECLHGYAGDNAILREMALDITPEVLDKALVRAAALGLGKGQELARA